MSTSSYSNISVTYLTVGDQVSKCGLESVEIHKTLYSGLLKEVSHSHLEACHFDHSHLVLQDITFTRTVALKKLQLLKQGKAFGIDEVPTIIHTNQ